MNVPFISNTKIEWISNNLSKSIELTKKSNQKFIESFLIATKTAYYNISHFYDNIAPEKTIIWNYLSHIDYKFLNIIYQKGAPCIQSYMLMMK